MHKPIALLSIAFLFLAFGCLGFGTPQAAPAQNGTNGSQPQANGTIIGGGADSHGCLGSAGYTWCQEKNKCLRTWEEKCEVMLPAGAALNVMKESTCSDLKGRAAVQTNDSIPCEAGEIPLAEIYMESGAKKFCCRSMKPEVTPTPASPPLPENTTAPTSPVPPLPEGYVPPNATGGPAT